MNKMNINKDWYGVNINSFNVYKLSVWGNTQEKVNKVRADIEGGTLKTFATKAEAEAFAEPLKLKKAIHDKMMNSGAIGNSYIESVIRIFEDFVDEQDHNEMLLAKLKIIKRDLLRCNDLWIANKKYLFQENTMAFIHEIKDLMDDETKELINFNVVIVNDFDETLPMAVLDIENKYHEKLGFDPANKDDVSPENHPSSPTPKPIRHGWEKIGDIDYPFSTKLNVENFVQVKLTYELKEDWRYHHREYNIQLPTILLPALTVGTIYSLGTPLLTQKHGDQLNHNYDSILYRLNDDNTFEFMEEGNDLISGQTYKMVLWGK